MYSSIFLKTENELNKVLRLQKKTKDNIGILFLSLWDPQSQTILKKIRTNKSFRKKEGSKPLYIVDSFTMPHAFVIHNVTKCPTLISLSRDKYVKEDYLPRIYSELGCEPVTFSI